MVEDCTFATNSPCIDHGKPAAWMTSGMDLDGEDRIMNGVPDMGAYDFNPDTFRCDFTGSPLVGLTPLEVIYQATVGGTNLVAVTNDLDGNPRPLDGDFDGTNDYLCITDITVSSPVTIYFDSSSDRCYTLNYCSNLVEGTWTNVPGAGPRVGAGGADSMQDTNDPPRGPFYRVGVELP